MEQGEVSFLDKGCKVTEAILTACFVPLCPCHFLLNIFLTLRLNIKNFKISKRCAKYVQKRTERNGEKEE